MDRSADITDLLSRLRGDGSSSDERVIDQLMPIVYGELKALARANRYRWDGRSGSETTSLVHEAYYKLAKQDGAEFENRRQFFYIASRAMRSILIDNLRRRKRQRRGGGAEHLPLDEARLVSAERSAELLALDEALSRLEREEADLARVIECRTFGGLTAEETAEALGLSSATVTRRWRLARAWLFREMKAGGAERVLPG